MACEQAGQAASLQTDQFGGCRLCRTATPPVQDAVFIRPDCVSGEAASLARLALHAGRAHVNEEPMWLLRKICLSGQARSPHLEMDCFTCGGC